MENHKAYILHISPNRKYLIVVAVSGVLLLVGIIIGINMYYRMPDSYGHSRIEIEQAENVIQTYISCLEQGDRVGAERCIVAGGELKISMEYNLEWTRYLVRDLRYEPDNTAYYQVIKTMEQQSIEAQDWMLLIMDCDWIMRYDTDTVTAGWIMVREDRSKQWKILRNFVF